MGRAAPHNTGQTSCPGGSWRRSCQDRVGGSHCVCNGSESGPFPDRGITRRLFPRLPPGFQGYRASDQGGSFPSIQLAVEAKPHVPAAMPPDYRRAAERSAVQYHGRSDRQACWTVELRTGGRQVEEMDSMTLSVGLKKRRQRHRHARVDAAVLIRRTILRGCGVCHVASGDDLAEGCCQSMNAECRQLGERRRLTFCH